TAATQATTMHLEPIDDDRIDAMMTWFPDAAACLVWGGVDFRFPYTDETFRTDARIADLPSYALVDDAGAFVGFGQYYRRLGRCHVARLAVAPDARGRGCGSVLIEQLCKLGHRTLGVAGDSLFVLEQNVDAKRLYLRLGFRDATYPEALPPAHVYMVRDPA
ncbi:MAG TPA: GNAT family N-acetyltransferase, partial [Tahibacter sp.]|nr:GNAT family N-acetyltransferase [Tahibacter sp.]